MAELSNKYNAAIVQGKLGAPISLTKKKTLACVGGICKEVDFSTPEAIATCKGKNVGDPCSVKPYEPVGPAEGCKGGHRLHEGPHIPGAPGQPQCKEGLVAEYNKEDGWTWCCPGKDWKVCAGGYRQPTVDGKMLKPCNEGFEPKHFTVEGQDQTWCCPITEPVIDEDGEGCEGGYKLSGAAISAGGGKLWTDAIIKPEHGWYRDSTAAGHWIWHKEHGYQKLADVHASIQGTKTLTKYEGGACRKGFQPKVMGGVTWCCPEGGNGNGGNGPGEEFTWSPEMQEAIRRMMERFEEMLDRPYGLSEEERQAIINYYTSGIKRGERGSLQSVEDRLARMGMAGGGLELHEAGRVQRGTREQVAGVTQGLGIDEISKSIQNYLQTTGMAQGLLGTLMGAETVPESLSAARRGEGLSQQQMILQYLGTLMGGQSNAYWQAIMNYMNQGGQKQGGDIMDWLPWLFASF